MKAIVVSKPTTHIRLLYLFQCGLSMDGHSVLHEPPALTQESADQFEEAINDFITGVEEDEIDIPDADRMLKKYCVAVKTSKTFAEEVALRAEEKTELDGLASQEEQNHADGNRFTVLQDKQKKSNLAEQQLTNAKTKLQSIVVHFGESYGWECKWYGDRCRCQL